MSKVILNQIVPNFQFDSSAGVQRRLSDFRGKKVLIYFYPKDHTSGCTCEAEDFRDYYEEFQRRGVVILGVSRDSQKSHEKFATALQLPFELISDPKEELCQLFNVIKPKTMYGKPVRGIERSTFLIDESSVLRQEWRGVKVPGHVKTLIEII